MSLRAFANSDRWFVSLASAQKFFFTGKKSGRSSEIKKISYEVEISKLYLAMNSISTYVIRNNITWDSLLFTLYKPRSGLLQEKSDQSDMSHNIQKNKF